MIYKSTFNILTILALSFVIFAQAQSGVGVSPPRVELASSVAGQLTQEVAIDNPSEVASLEVTVTLGDALFQPDGSVLYLEPGSHPGSLTSWLSVDTLQFTLEPQASETLRYTVQVPEETPDGTYWGLLFFESQVLGSEETASAGIGVRSRVRIGHVIYIDVGQTVRTGEVEGIRYTVGETPELRMMFRNTGNALLRPSGKVELRSEQGDLLSTFNIPATAAFPGYAREIVAPLEEPLGPGNYIALAVLDYGAATVIAGEGRIVVP